MKGNGEAELYAVQQERSHNITSSVQAGRVVIIVHIGRFLEILDQNPDELRDRGHSVQ